jgi:hypothetical protein
MSWAGEGGEIREEAWHPSETPPWALFRREGKAASQDAPLKIADGASDDNSPQMADLSTLTTTPAEN